MTGRRGALAPGLLLAGVSAATTWVAMWSWAGFSELPGRFLGPLLVLGALVAGTGALARWQRLPAVTVVGLQLLASALLCSTMLCGSPLPVGSAWVRLQHNFSAAMDSAQRYAAPVPAHAPGVHPLLILGGLACLLVVDVLACTLRRVPLAGLPLLTVYSIPVSLVGGGVSWWVFALTAAGFLTMLFLQEGEQVARWGRPLGQDPAQADPSGFGVSTGAVRTSAGTIGSVATALALVVPLLIPTWGLHLLDGGRGPGDGQDITISNPITDLRRDLHRGEDLPLLRVTTDDPNPGYLRIAVLNHYDDEEWSAGSREVPANNLPDGDMPALLGVASTVPRTEYHYKVSVLPTFDSTWLPTQAPISRIVAGGDWRYDPSTMDFLAGRSGLTTAGMRYTMSAVKLDLNAADLARATSSSGLVSRRYTELPAGIPTIVRTLANEVTRDAPSRYEKAVALQNWFRQDGGFTYSLADAPSGSGTSDLVSFLTPGNGGRTGYCEQFASSMAIMARMLGIPARVAVGFLEPRTVGGKTWEYSAYDLHAWPELFFPGSGWVAFEPTPAGRASSVPSYTRQHVPVVNPTQRPDAQQPGNDLPNRGRSSGSSAGAAPQENKHSGHRDSSFPWGAAAGGLGGVLLLALLGLVPRAVRRLRRERALAGGPEEAWAELRATALDLGLPWPESRSPRETRDRLVPFLGAPVDAGTAERPAHGSRVAPEGVAALDRLVRGVELARYARRPEEPASLREDLETCLAALAGGASRAARRRAEWWPRSVLTRQGRSGSRALDAPTVQARYGGVVDHVG